MFEMSSFLPSSKGNSRALRRCLLLVTILIIYIVGWQVVLFLASPVKNRSRDRLHVMSQSTKTPIPRKLTPTPPTTSPMAHGVDMHADETDLPEEHSALGGKHCVCPQVTRCYDAEIEMRCLEYLSDFQNVIRVRPMVSSLQRGRTAKFHLYYKDACVESVVKPPQSLFPLEPYSEYAAFELDRMLDLGNIPPTTWMFVPVSEIEIAARDFQNSWSNKKRSSSKNGSALDHDTVYASWIAKEVLVYAMNHAKVIPHPSTGQMVLGCSVQLFIRSTRSPFNTPLQMSNDFNSILRYDGTVHATIDAALQGKRRVEDQELASLFGHYTQTLQLKMRKDEAAARELKRRGVAPSDVPQKIAVKDRKFDLLFGQSLNDIDLDDETVREPRGVPSYVTATAKALNRLVYSKPSNFAAREALPLVLENIAETLLFDTILGNDDRSATKNSHIYTLNLSDIPQKCNVLEHIRHKIVLEQKSGNARHGVYHKDDSVALQNSTSLLLRYVWLDQGKSFYTEELPHGAFSDNLLHPSSVCVFHRATLAGIRALGNGGFYRHMKEIVPRPLLEAISEKRLVWASKRVDVILYHFHQCVDALGGEGRVVMWN